MVISKARLLTALLSLLVSTGLSAAPKGGGGSSPSADITGTGCSPYMGQATLNEFYKASPNQSANSNDFLEFKVLDATVTNVDYDGWTVRVCEYDASGNNNDSDGCSSHAAVSGFSDSTYPWIVWKGESLGRYVNFKTGFDAVLKDADGKPIDYFSFKGYELQYDTSCTYTYDTHHSASGGSAKIIQRKTNDGTADWSHETSGSVDPTEGASNDGDSGSDVDHYSISHDGAGVTCLLESITISAHDSTHTAIDADGVTVNLSTTSGKGNWVGIVSGATGLNNGTADDGAASFTFSAGATSAVLTFAHPVLSGNSETFGFNVTDGSMTENSGNAIAADDPAITYELAGFRFIDSAGSDLPWQIAGKPSMTLPYTDKDLYLQAVQASDNDPSICTAALTGTQTIRLAAQCDNPTTCISGKSFNLQSGSNPAVDISLNDAFPATPVTYSDVEMTFDAQARAPFVINYNDAGLMQLHASYTVPDTGAIITGSSNQFVVRPFAFGFPSIKAGLLDNPAGDETGGAGFVSAGSLFNAAVNAYLYSSADDSNSDGIPDAIDSDADGLLDIVADVTDNGVTPNFEGTATLSADSTFYTPLVGNAGTLAATGGLNVALAIGSTPTLSGDLSYSEVGSFYLRADLHDYMGEVIPSEFRKVGRIFPDHFVLVSSDLSAACQAGTHFTYMQQPFNELSYVLEARSANDEVTTRYDIGWYKDTASVGLQAENNDDGTDLSDRLITDGSESLAGWDLGVVSAALSSLTFQRSGGSSAGLEDGPFNLLQLGLKITAEPDGRDFKDSAKNMQATTAGACSSPDCDAIAVGSTQVVRYGRLYIQSAHGPETQDLSVPFGVQYWNGSAFVSTLDDSCTTLPLSTVTFDGSSIDSVAARTVAVGGGSTTGELSNNGTEAEALVGSFGLQFSAPGEGNSGYFYVDVTSVPEWLRYDWNQDGAANDLSVPDALITFGRARGNDRMIFWQERYQ